MRRLFAPTILLLLLWALPAGASTLKRDIDHILKASQADQGKVSIQIVSLNDGAILYEKNASLALNPASNVKIVTAAAALDLLGPDFTFKTVFYARRKMRTGMIGDIWMKGYGDPFYVTEEQEALVRRWTFSGLKKIEGNLYVDDSYFDHENLVTFLTSAGDAVDTIRTGALSFNFNNIQILAKPGPRAGAQPEIATIPETKFVEIVNQAQTVESARPKLTAQIEKNSPRKLVIRGRIPKRHREFSISQGVLETSLFTGTVFRESLEAAGVEVSGEVKREAVPEQGLPVFEHSSPPLRKLLYALGKYSNNYTAEQILKVMGAEKFGAPGSFRKGLRVLEDYLVATGIPRNQFHLDNGSGLSRNNRLSAAHIVAVLRRLHHSDNRDAFLETLSIAGVDGTLRKTMRQAPLRGQVLAKTGTLHGVSSLSGYLTLPDKEPVAFSILLNDTPFSSHTAHKVEEKILRAVWNHAAREIKRKEVRL